MLRVERAVATVMFADAPVAAFLTIANTGPADILTKVESDIAEYAWVATQQPHRMRMVGAGLPPILMPADPLAIPARRSTTLTPGGNPLVFYELRQPVRPGDTVPVRLTFASGAVIETAIPVVDYEDVEATIDPRAYARIPAGEVLSVELGSDLYRANGCAACHGVGGRGDGPVAPTLNPRPRDLADPASYRMGTDAAVIARTLGAGLAGAGSMPLFAHLSNYERQAIALYIRSLQVKSSH
jgi:copper(I)-binding protein